MTSWFFGKPRLGPLVAATGIGTALIASGLLVFSRPQIGPANLQPGNPPTLRQQKVDVGGVLRPASDVQAKVSRIEQDRKTIRLVLQRSYWLGA